MQAIEKQCAQIRQDFAAKKNEVASAVTPEAVERLRVEFTGKKSVLMTSYALLRELSPDDKKTAGALLNETRQFVEAELDSLKDAAKGASFSTLLSHSYGDLTLPVETRVGSLHPVTLMRQKILGIFRQMGFSVVDGPEIDLDFYNFSALNFPDDHPARDMQDTFFVDSPNPQVLRTHTSNIQIHTMLSHGAPCRVVAPGRTFRCDSDLTHTPMFHQIEALVVDRNISLAHLKSTIDVFLKAVYGNDLKTRLRPSFFPFVEPGAEIDVQCVQCRGKGCKVCKETGWLEIGGCGMVHPNVFEAVDINSESYTGFAFGFGLDRMAMLHYSLGDLRLLFEGQESFLGQFPLSI